jgi:hypothetical protein
MTGEIENSIRSIVKDKGIAQEILRVFSEAGKEFPCLNCTSREDCQSFKWFGDASTNS